MYPNFVHLRIPVNKNGNIKTWQHTNRNELIIKKKNQKTNEQNNTYKLLCFMYGRWILYWKKIGKYKKHEHEPPTLSEIILK